MRKKPNNSLYKNYEVTEIYPYFFYKTCEKCGDKIKRELMWKVDIYLGRWGNISYDGNLNAHKIFCKDCFTRSELIDLCEQKCQ